MFYCVHQASDDLNPIRVHALFSAVPDEECELLDLAGRPEDLIISVVQVPPVCIRPSVEVDGGGGSNEDDITVKLGVTLTSFLYMLALERHKAQSDVLFIPNSIPRLGCSPEMCPSYHNSVGAVLL